MNVKRRHGFVPLCYFINFFICYLLKFRKELIFDYTGLVIHQSVF
jgi:hypothetical protein